VERRNAKGSLLAWQGWAAMTRAVHAHERNDAAAFEAQCQHAKQLFADAAAAPPSAQYRIGVITGVRI
jgi:hypothetical protein